MAVNYLLLQPLVFLEGYYYPVVVTIYISIVINSSILFATVARNVESFAADVDIDSTDFARYVADLVQV